LIYQPDVVLYDAGVDVHHDDRLGYLSLSSDGLYARDRYVLDLCRHAAFPWRRQTYWRLINAPIEKDERDARYFSGR